MAASEKIKKGFFITGTDTGIGKTVVTFALGVLFQQKGCDIGVIKPIQCGGSDAEFLKKSLAIKDSLKEINPFYAPEPLSPHLAFKRQKKEIHIKKILEGYQKLQSKHEIVLVEGAGGLLVPIKEDYLVADLARDLDLEIIIVSRLGLGTINHTLLTINQAKNLGLKIGGIVFSVNHPRKMGVPERTNPKTIERLSGIPVLGTVPYLKNLNRKEIIRQCLSKVNVNKILSSLRAPQGRSNPYKDCFVAPKGLLAMTENMNLGAKRWGDLDKQYLWHPFTQMQDWLKEEPLVIDRAEGRYLIDTHGRRYLDGISSLWVNIHGHNKKEINEAIIRQLNRVEHSTLLGLSNVPAIELAQELIEIAPKGLAKVFYSDSGSTSVEVALKMAYQYWQNIGKTKKRHIVHFEHSYHGDTLGGVSVGGIELFHKVYRDLIFKAVKVNSPYAFPVPKGMTQSAYAFSRLRKFEETIEKHHDTIAAVIVEPLVQAAAGMLVWPLGILKRIARVCKQYDCFLIADEVATGFGRTGKMFACEHENVTPDFLCLAKGLTGGYLPLAATLTTQRVFNGFLFPYKDQKTFFHGHTYTGNPLACAAALANLEVFKKEKTLYNLQPKIRQLTVELKRFRRSPHVGDVRQKGFMVGIELVRRKNPYQPYAWEEKVGIKVCQEVRRHGVTLRPLGNVIVLMPPLAISNSELKKMLDITYRAIKQVTKNI